VRDLGRAPRIFGAQLNGKVNVQQCNPIAQSILEGAAGLQGLLSTAHFDRATKFQGATELKNEMTSTNPNRKEAVSRTGAISPYRRRVASSYRACIPSLTTARLAAWNHAGAKGPAGSNGSTGSNGAGLHPRKFTFLRRHVFDVFVRLYTIVAGAKRENERCSEARHAEGLYLLSRTLDASRAPRTVLVGGVILSTVLLSCFFTLSAHASILIHGVDDVLANYTFEQNGKLYFAVPSVQAWEFITDVSDPDITNKGDGAFHTFDMSVVKQALAETSYPLDQLELEIFILPFPRRGVLNSSATTGKMFLSPGVYQFIPEQEHYTVTHELGHVIHRRFMPDDASPLWQEYRELRRITDTAVYNNTAIHRNRPNEIFAEDFRFLFGSRLANYCGSIENRDLPLPTEVAGLKDFFLSLPATVTVDDVAALIELLTFPNPFNPVLNISFSVSGAGAGTSAPVGDASSVGASSGSSSGGSTPDQSAGLGQTTQRLRLRIFDVNGRLVSTLIDGALQPGNYSAVWNGTDERGTSVSSGVYFLKLEVGSEAAVRKVILAR